uniref:Uncharacterized protein n=1 Tax=Glossina palpalis gambiensis TaxID=67801 RepID=A0A1B0AWB3_9MUSC
MHKKITDISGPPKTNNSHSGNPKLKVSTPRPANKTIDTVDAIPTLKQNLQPAHFKRNAKHPEPAKEMKDMYNVEEVTMLSMAMPCRGVAPKAAMKGLNSFSICNVLESSTENGAAFCNHLETHILSH